MSTESKLPVSYINSIGMREEYRFNENEIRSFVYHWFALFDKHVDVDQFLVLIADDGLEMQYPGASKISSQENFKNWYEQVGDVIKSNTHAVEQIHFNYTVDRKYEVELVVLWQAVTKDDKYDSLRVRQTWLLDDGQGGQWPRLLKLSSTPC
jgi:ketosteroid isomerase-like protein